MLILIAALASFLVFFLVMILWRWVVFKHVIKDPLLVDLLSVGATWLSLGIVAGSKQPVFDWIAFGVLLLPAAFFTFLCIRAHKAAHAEAAEDAAEIFR